jgi:fatty-acid desaturase
LTIGASLFLIAIGAILKYAVTWTPVGIDLHVAGVVLMVVGVVGLVLGLFLLLYHRAPQVGPPPPPPV